MEKVLIEMTKPQFMKEVLALKSMPKKMAVKALAIGDENSKRLQLVMRVVNELRKNNFSIEALEEVALVKDVKTGKESMKIFFSRPLPGTKPNETYKHFGANGS